MTVPVAYVGIDLGVADTDVFVIDDATHGKVANANSLLGYGVTEITDHTPRVRISRGSSEALGLVIDPGTATIILNNEDRRFDPTHATGAYYGELVPGRKVIVAANDTVIYTGYVEDFDVAYSISGRSVASVKCIDALGNLAHAESDEWESVGTSADAKIADAIAQTDVEWESGLTDFDAGLALLQADTVSWGSNILNYCQLVARSDLGWFFARADGYLAYRNRLRAFGTSAATLHDAHGSGGIQFHEFTAQVGSETLYSRVGYGFEGGTEETVSVDDLDAWKESYGPARSLTVSTSLADSGAEASGLARYLLDRHREPAYQVRTVTLLLESLSTANQNTILGLEIGDVVTVEVTPNGVGAEVSSENWIIGIEHNMSPPAHEVVLQLVAAKPAGDEAFDVSLWGTGEWT